jgi:hypothetical protein
MMQPTLFWSGPAGYGVEQEIEPGSHPTSYWRRVLAAQLIEGREQPGVGKLAIATTQTPAVLLEAVLEWVRVTEFPALPSRSSCHFTWDREDWGRKYHEMVREAWLYEVQPQDYQRLFRADYVIGNAFREGDTLAKLHIRARRYGRGEVDPDGRPEILVPGPIRVVRIII